MTLLFLLVIQSASSSEPGEIFLPYPTLRDEWKERNFLYLPL